MPQLIRQRELVVDEWRNIDADARGPALIIPFARWQAERDQWWSWDGKLGVRIGPTDPIDALERDFARLSLIAIEFGGIGEGRGYTQAQLLKKRYQFTGEIRAVGKIQRDQLFYLARCGFNAFELPDDADVAVALAAFNDFSVKYQDASDEGLSLRQRVAGTAAP